MLSPESLALFWIEKIIAIAIIFQSIELLQIRRTFNDQGVWTWNVLKKEFDIFPLFIPKLLDVCLKYPNFLYLLYVRLFAATLILLISHPAFMLILLMMTILISVRWRGTFNGGSDYMTIIILMALCIASFFKDNRVVSFGCLWYISIQACSSYFIAGIIKLQKNNWRTGKALPGFVNSTLYDPSVSLKFLSNSSVTALGAAWIIMIFECSFPLALVSPELCLPFVTAAFIFHLVNVYVFGLNRFLFVWAATYPAIYYCSYFRIAA